MTSQQQNPDHVSQLTASASITRSAARRDQLIAFVAAGILLIATIVIRPNLVALRRDIVRAPGGPAAEASAKRLAIEFPRLALGGFRGLLATLLWKEAEDSKNDRKWMRLESLYDYIAVLQPYVVSVYVFHSWNQAYNLSAQWHEIENKYKWVLDGLSYLYKGEEFNPESADIQVEIAQMYFLKLGTSFERTFYRKQWRSDLARLHELDLSVATPKTAALRHVYDSAVKPQFKITLRPDPKKLVPKLGYGVDVHDFPKTGEVLSRRFGVSPFYFSYIEYKRTLANRNRPTNTGIVVLDGWPAMSLRMWCRDDLYYTASETQFRFIADEYGNMENTLQAAIRTPEIGYTKAMTNFANSPDYQRWVAEMNETFLNVPIVGPKAIEEFEAHLERFPGQHSVHDKHVTETKYYMAVHKAEKELFDGLIELVNNHGEPNKECIEKLTAAREDYVPAKEALNVWLHTVDKNPEKNMDENDLLEYTVYRIIMDRRRVGIEQLLTDLRDPKTRGQVDFSFLIGNVVEK